MLRVCIGVVYEPESIFALLTKAGRPGPKPSTLNPTCNRKLKTYLFKELYIETIIRNPKNEVFSVTGRPYLTEDVRDPLVDSIPICLSKWVQSSYVAQKIGFRVSSLGFWGL